VPQMLTGNEIVQFLRSYKPYWNEVQAFRADYADPESFQGAFYRNSSETLQHEVMRLNRRYHMPPAVDRVTRRVITQGDDVPGLALRNVRVRDDLYDCVALYIQNGILAQMDWEMDTELVLPCAEGADCKHCMDQPCKELSEEYEKLFLEASLLSFDDYPTDCWTSAEQVVAEFENDNLRLVYTDITMRMGVLTRTEYRVGFPSSPGYISNFGDIHLSFCREDYPVVSGSLRDNSLIPSDRGDQERLRTRRSQTAPQRATTHASEFPPGFPKTAKAREKHRQVYRIWLQLKKEYLKEYDDMNTDNPDPTPHDLRAKLVELARTKGTHSRGIPKAYCPDYLADIIRWGDAGFYDKLE